jgi:hypothetical protein
MGRTTGGIVTIVEIAVKMSKEIEKRVAAGEYVRVGSVVRDLAGRIVDHLPEVPLPEKAREATAQVSVKALTNPKVIGLGLGVLAATTGGAAGFVLGKKKQAAELERPKSVENCIASLSAYLQAVHNGRLVLQTLHRLRSDLDSVNKESGSGKIEILAHQLEVLVAIVADHTKKLAAANSIDVSEVWGHSPRGGDGKIVSLQHHLRVQERILRESA